MTEGPLDELDTRCAEAEKNLQGIAGCSCVVLIAAIAAGLAALIYTLV